MSGFWTDVPRGSVTRLVAADPQMFGHLPAPAPAVVAWRPEGSVDASAVLGELERTALRLFPAWLPGAEWIEEPSGLGVAAVRKLARQHAAQTEDYGPFFTDLAERAISGRPTSVAFPDAVRAAGLARVIAAGSRRTEMALVIDLPAGMTPEAESALIASCRRVASMGQFSVWLTGAEPHSPNVPVVNFAGAPDQDPPPDTEVPLSLPLAGQPHPRSLVEQTLEGALRRRLWAAGRQWNQTHRFHVLANPVRLDLLWEAERLNVEIDGPEHHDPEHYAADRRRDVDLQLAGFAVLRFTNAEVEHDVDAVVTRIERFINGRRQAA